MFDGLLYLLNGGEAWKDQNFRTNPYSQHLWLPYPDVARTPLCWYSTEPFLLLAKIIIYRICPWRADQRAGRLMGYDSNHQVRCSRVEFLRCPITLQLILPVPQTRKAPQHARTGLNIQDSPSCAHFNRPCVDMEDRMQQESQGQELRLVSQDPVPPLAPPSPYPVPIAQVLTRPRNPHNKHSSLGLFPSKRPLLASSLLS